MLGVLAHCHEFAAFSSGPRYAAELAKILGASLTGLYIAPPLPSLPPTGEPPSLHDEFVTYVHDEIECAQQAGQSFIRWAASIGVNSCHWQLALGQAPEILTAAGNWTDFLVVEYRARVPPDCFTTFGKTLLSGVRCIVVPEATDAQPSCDRIAIAWNGSQEAIRATHAALPILRQARQIYVLSSPSPVKLRQIACESGFSIDSYLAHHGLTAQHVALDLSDRSPAEAILLAAANVAADLIVLGAFGTSRFRDAASHGTTRHILENSGVPLFLRH